jgi:anti-sigma factor RsiW
MSTCHDIDSLATPYVDGELADADRRALDHHVRVCAPCHSRIAAERTVREVIRARQTALCAAAAPTALRAKCATLIAERSAAASAPSALRRALPMLALFSRERRQEGPRHNRNDAASQLRNPPQLGNVAQGFSPASRRARLTPYALAASLVLIVGSAFVYQATDASARVMAMELTADHVKCFALNRMFGTQQAAGAVESSMMSSFGWNVHLPEHAARAGLDLVGSRPCLYGEGKIAHIMYRHQGRPVSLFMLPDSARTQELVEVLGHEAAIWCVGNRTFVLVARAPRQDVERLASFVRSALH